MKEKVGAGQGEMEKDQSIYDFFIKGIGEEKQTWKFITI